MKMKQPVRMRTLEKVGMVGSPMRVQVAGGLADRVESVGIVS